MVKMGVFQNGRRKSIKSHNYGHSKAREMYLVSTCMFLRVSDPLETQQSM